MASTLAQQLDAIRAGKFTNDEGDGTGTLKDIPLEELFDEIVNILTLESHAWRGYSIKNQGWARLLVWKTYYQDTPYVVFVTDKSVTACMRSLLRKVARNEVSWVKDKFA